MQTMHIDVYKDSAEWAKHKRWFMVPKHILDDLFITRYTVEGESVDYSDVARHAKEVAAMHPDTVLVY